MRGLLCLAAGLQLLPDQPPPAGLHLPPAGLVAAYTVGRPVARPSLCLHSLLVWTWPAAHTRVSRLLTRLCRLRACRPALPCRSEFSGFLLYKELGRRLKDSNPCVAEIFTLLARDEARHAGFINKALSGEGQQGGRAGGWQQPAGFAFLCVAAAGRLQLGGMRCWRGLPCACAACPSSPTDPLPVPCPASDFNLALDLGFLTKNRTYTFFKPKVRSFYSEGLGSWRLVGAGGGRRAAGFHLAAAVVVLQ